MLCHTYAQMDRLIVLQGWPGWLNFAAGSINSNDSTTYNQRINVRKETEPGIFFINTKLPVPPVPGRKIIPAWNNDKFQKEYADE